MLSPSRLLAPLLCLLLAASGALAQAPLTLTPSLAPMLEKVVPGVVAIQVHGKILASEGSSLAELFFGLVEKQPDGSVAAERDFRAVGSGFIVDAAKGYILTNNHVVAQADEINVTLNDGRKFPARKVGADAAADIAVIQIGAENLLALELGDSDAVRMGDFVVALGNPFGLGQTASLGIVSARARPGLGLPGYEDFIQTDAMIDPGHSGGPLVNLKGEVVGINTAILGPSGSDVGMGFTIAIPINLARRVMLRLISVGAVIGPGLRVLAQDFAPAANAPRSASLGPP